MQVISESYAMSREQQALFYNALGNLSRDEVFSPPVII